MKIKIARGLGALALVLSAVALGADDQPAFAAGHCPNNNHPNLSNQTVRDDFVRDGVAIRNGDGGGCAIVGYGNATDDVVLHCYTFYSDQYWVHLKNITNGVSGWVRNTNLHYMTERGC